MNNFCEINCSQKTRNKKRFELHTSLLFFVDLLNSRIEDRSHIVSNEV